MLRPPVKSVQQVLDRLKQMSLHNESVVLLLVDEQMPEMGGSEFLREARDLYPQARPFGSSIDTWARYEMRE